MKNITNIAIIEANPKDNVSREGRTTHELLFAGNHLAKFKALATSMSERYNVAYPIVVREVDKEEADLLYSLRNERYNKIVEACESNEATTINIGDIKVSPQLHLQAFKTLYMKDGKIIRPKVAVVSGFRRALTVEYAQAIRISQGNHDVVEIFSVVKNYATNTERLADTIAENVIKNEGVDKLTDKDLLLAVEALYHSDSTLREADLMRMIQFKRGTAQKFDRAWKLNVKFPDLRIWERAMLPEDNEQYVPFKSFNKEVLKKYLDNNDDQDTVEKYIVKPIKDPNKKKIADRNAIEKSAENHPVKIVQDVLSAVMRNDLKSLKFNKEQIEALNHSYKAVLK